ADDARKILNNDGTCPICDQVLSKRMIMRNFVSNAWSKINNIVCIECRPFLECNHPITLFAATISGRGNVPSESRQRRTLRIDSAHTREEAIPTCHGRGGGDGMRLTGAWTLSPIPPVVADILVQGQSANEWGGIEFPLPFGRVLSPTESFIHELDEK
ncbi:hypothetical protein ACJX0J_034718, partial [Zea mays]